MNLSKNIKFFMLVMFALFVNFTALQASATDEHAEKSFNLKEMIFHHVLDNYEWHLITIGENDFSLPLPIIVKSSERGWFVFSSAQLRGGKSYEGFRINHGEKYNNKIVEKVKSGAEVRPLDLSLTKDAAAILLSCIVLILVFVRMANSYKIEPFKARKGLFGALEMLIVALVDDVIKPSVGKNYKRYVPYLLTAFFFIFMNDLLGLIPVFPAGVNVTGNIAVTLVLALITFTITNVFAGKEYFKEIFWPDVPLWLKFPIPIMPFVELLGVFTKPFALMVRLFANILAGHMIILVLMGLIFIFYGLFGAVAASSVSILSIAFSIFMLILDVLVSFIQAYVFTMLSALFIGMGQVEHHAKPISSTED